MRTIDAAARESPRHISRAAALFFCAAIFLAGCRSNHPQARPVLLDKELSPPTAVAVLQAMCVPPLGWKPDPIKRSSTHVHEVWLSPTGRTAYGVIHFDLPLPVGPDLALWGFLNEMRATEGEAKLLEKKWDANLGGLRFVAEGGQYIVRTNLFVDGFSGWAVYAGTLRSFPINQAELELAERAREDTVIGPIK